MSYDVDLTHAVGTTNLVHADIDVLASDWDSNRYAIVDALIDRLAPAVGTYRAEHGTVHVSKGRSSDDGASRVHIKLVASP